MVALQSVQRRNGLTHHSVLSPSVTECQKNQKGGLDQYGAERFGRLIFATLRTSVGLNGLETTACFQAVQIR